MNTVIYGIKNCDTMKKALNWLQLQGIAVTFHDYRKDGLDQQMLSQFLQALDWQDVLNKRGTTFRALSDEQKNTLTESSAMALMLAQPAMIKRPLLYHAGEYHLGFKPDQYMAIFAR